LLDLFKQNLRNSKESPPVESKLTTICTQTELNGTKKNQDDSLPAAVDGYFINRMGHELVHLKRVGSDEKGVSDLLEYNNHSPKQSSEMPPSPSTIVALSCK
jgi:hypothetical protein